MAGDREYWVEEVCNRVPCKADCETCLWAEEALETLEEEDERGRGKTNAET